MQTCVCRQLISPADSTFPIPHLPAKVAHEPTCWAIYNLDKSPPVLQECLEEGQFKGLGTSSASATPLDMGQIQGPAAPYISPVEGGPLLRLLCVVCAYVCPSQHPFLGDRLFLCPPSSGWERSQGTGLPYASGRSCGDEFHKQTGGQGGSGPCFRAMVGLCHLLVLL